MKRIKNIFWIKKLVWKSFLKDFRMLETLLWKIYDEWGCFELGECVEFGNLVNFIKLWKVLWNLWIFDIFQWKPWKTTVSAPPFTLVVKKLPLLDPLPQNPNFKIQVIPKWNRKKYYANFIVNKFSFTIFKTNFHPRKPGNSPIIFPKNEDNLAENSTKKNWNSILW